MNCYNANHEVQSYKNAAGLKCNVMPRIMVIGTIKQLCKKINALKSLALNNLSVVKFKIIAS